MKKRVSKLNSISSVYKRIDALRSYFEVHDVSLNYGNGSIFNQLDCALASLDCILQEYDRIIEL